MQITQDDLLRIIGRKEAEIEILKNYIRVLQMNKSEDAAAEEVEKTKPSKRAKAVKEDA